MARAESALGAYAEEQMRRHGSLMGLEQDYEELERALGRPVERPYTIDREPDSNDSMR